MVQNSYQENLQSDLSKALLKIDSLEKSIHQLKEDLIACLFNHQNNKVVNNGTPSLGNTAKPGTQIVSKKEEPESVHTVDI